MPLTIWLKRIREPWRDGSLELGEQRALRDVRFIVPINIAPAVWNGVRPTKLERGVRVPVGAPLLGSINVHFTLDYELKRVAKLRREGLANQKKVLDFQSKVSYNGLSRRRDSCGR